MFEKVVNAKKHNLWRDLDEIAMFFALIGASGDGVGTPCGSDCSRFVELPLAVMSLRVRNLA